MAVFMSESRLEAERKLRDFPANWELTEEGVRYGVRVYRCKSDPSIMATIFDEGIGNWITEVWQVTPRARKGAAHA